MVCFGRSLNLRGYFCYEGLPAPASCRALQRLTELAKRFEK